MNYFHITGILLAEGSVIEPGNFGRMLQTYQHDLRFSANGYRIAAELFFEQERRDANPMAPSRLECAYAFLDIDTARNQKGRLGGSTSVIYEVALVDPDAQSHVGSFDLITQAFTECQQPFLPKINSIAKRYWGNGPFDVPELLTTSSLRVLRRVE